MSKSFEKTLIKKAFPDNNLPLNSKHDSNFTITGQSYGTPDRVSKKRTVPANVGRLGTLGLYLSG